MLGELRGQRGCNSVEPLQKIVTEERFLKRLQKEYGIKTVYYPGWGGDRRLSKIFPRVTYLDSNSHVQRNDRDIVGDFTKAPLGTGLFDGVYIRDIHLAETPGWEDILRTLKTSGIMMLSLAECLRNRFGVTKYGLDGKDDLALLRGTTILREMSPTFRCEGLVVFEKMNQEQLIDRLVASTLQPASGLQKI